MLKGSMVALVTPFKRGGDIDWETLEYLVDFHLNNKTDVIVPCGTTGESPTLNYEEHIKVIEFVVKKVNKRVPVLAGTGTNSTYETIYFTNEAKRVGADAALVIAPYYNKPTQRGLIEHFTAVSKETGGFPIVAYNVPSRTVINIEPQTLAEIVKRNPNVIGIKEASGNIKQCMDILEYVDKPDFALISGDDGINLAILKIGGVGAISVTANIVPKDMSDMINSYLSGDVKKAEEIDKKLQILNRVLFLETNPIPIKKALELVGIIKDGSLRLPLTELSEQNTQKLKDALVKYGFKINV
ncbi:MAG: 4-hydroxy-tetrahydrodipicolinate synthase [Spirochaetia bacterium]|nr:4-hydroxy-tetrahydrodipicolinate synthase [Spirochaetota bacterium]MDW8112427.1 4-hydroxy-tetrahydrodipicolinate synthase [Spirochaetia bacterium]